MLKLNNKGIGLIEAVIAASIIGVLCLGMGSVAANMSRIQGQANLLATLTMLQSNIQKSILDPNAWRNTVAASAGGGFNTVYSCIYNNATCTKTSGYPAAVGAEEATYTSFNKILDGNLTPADVFYDNGTNGFTYTGTPCATYVSDMTAPGSDQCPISYKLKTAMYCSDGSASCKNPSVLVYGFLHYHPGQGGIGYPVNTARYSISVSRVAGAFTRNDSVRIEDTTNGTFDPITTGPCTTGGVFRSFAAITALNDPATNATLTTADTITLRAGGYNCSAIATGNGVDGFQITLLVNGAAVSTSTQAYASSVSVPPGIAQARIPEITINQTADFTVKLLQQCATGGSAAEAFGKPLNFSTPNVFAGIYCTRVY